MGKVFAVMNRKGGVGKTTTAVTLAHGLSERARVLLVDLDPQGNCSTSLGVRVNGANIANLLTNDKVSVRESLVSADRSKSGGPPRPNLLLIPANDELARAKAYLIAREAASAVAAKFGGGSSGLVGIDDILVEKMGILRDVFDYIILDCPPSLDALQGAVYRFADAAIVPVKVDYLGAVGTVQHTEDIIAAQDDGINIRIGLVVPTFVRAREVLAQDILKSLVKKYGRNRVAAPIPQSVKVEQSPASGGLTIFEYAPDSDPAKAYRKLVEKVQNV